MQVKSISGAHFGGANTPIENRQPANPDRLLTTGQVATLTGLSESYFEKGRVYGYGPKFIRLRQGRRGGAVRYRPADVQSWLDEQQCDPEVRHG